jgi:hypothetical protein
LFELCFDGIDDFAEQWEVSIVQTLPPGELPDPFDRVEVWRVGRQIVEFESVGVLLAPVTVQPGMVITGIVGDNHHSSWPSGAGALEGFEKNTSRNKQNTPAK